MASCLLLHRPHAHGFPCPFLHHNTRYTPWTQVLSLHAGHVPHTEQREATEGPAGHDHLSLQGQPKSFTSLPIPEENGEGGVVLGDSHGLGVRRSGYEALPGHLSALELRAGDLTFLKPHFILHAIETIITLG